MQKRSSALTFILPALIIVTLGVIVLISFLSDKVHWTESYLPEDENPYGTKIFQTLLKEIRTDATFIQVQDSLSTLLSTSQTEQCDNYIYIGSEYYADSVDLVTLLNFAKNGNHVYLFTTSPSNLVFDSLLRAPTYSYVPAEFDAETIPAEEYSEEDEVVDDTTEVTHYEEYDEQKRIYYVQDTTVRLSFYDERHQDVQYPISYYYDFDKIRSNWPYFRDSLRTWQGDRIEPIGFFDEEYNNFIRLKYGKGAIFFHCTPVVFTNYFIRNDTAMRYCRTALNTLGNGKIYWDEENRTYDYKGLSRNANHSLSKPGEGPLEFILSEPGLRSAWYLLLLTVIVYLIFGARRKQRIIAVTKNMENTSIEYAEVLSHMFMKQKDHKKLVMMKMELFKAFLRDRFSLRLPVQLQDENEELYQEISQKTSVHIALVKEIFEKHKTFHSLVTIETAEMLEFHRNIEQFYTTCK